MSGSQTPQSTSSAESPSVYRASPVLHARNSELCQTSDIPYIHQSQVDSLNSLQIGKGTYGKVEKIKFRKSIKQPYVTAAIKFANEQSHQLALIREAKIMKDLNHPNVIKIYGIYDCPKNGRGVVMEFMDCNSLADLVKNRSIEYTMDHFASWMYQMASALEFFHSNNQLHRDLKLQNMLLSNRYRTLKVCDFGTFTKLDHTMTSNLGTPITMAPEVFKGEHYDMKSDIYSIGIIMWQLLARDEPYKSRHLNPSALLFNVALSQLRPPELNCNRLLSGFYKRCWHEDPQVRPNSQEVLKYFELLREEYPNGNEPLIEKLTLRQAGTPQPRSRNSPFSSNYSSGSTNLTAPQRSHRRGGSDQTNMIKLNVPSPSSVPRDARSDTAEAGVRGNRSRSVVNNLYTSTEPIYDRITPPYPEEGDPPIVHHKSSEESLSIGWNHHPELRPIEPDFNDQESINNYYKHNQECQKLFDALSTQKEVLAVKHKLLTLWNHYDEQEKLRSRVTYLEGILKQAQKLEDSQRTVERF